MSSIILAMTWQEGQSAPEAQQLPWRLLCQLQQQGPLMWVPLRRGAELRQWVGSHPGLDPGSGCGRAVRCHQQARARPDLPFLADPATDSSERFRQKLPLRALQRQRFAQQFSSGIDEIEAMLTTHCMWKQRQQMLLLRTTPGNALFDGRGSANQDRFFLDGLIRAA